MRLTLGKLKWAAASLLALAIVAAGALGLASRVSGGPPGPGNRPQAPKPVPASAEAPREGPGKIYFADDGGLVAVDPKTGEASKILIPCDMRPRVSPDGRLLAFQRDDALWVRELDKIVEPRRLLGLDGANSASPPVWSHDGSRLIVSLGRSDTQKHEPWRFTTVRINVDGSGREELKIPTEDGVDDWSPDDWLLTASSRNARIGWELYVMRPDGTEVRQITDGGNPFYARFSPDGKRVLYTDGTTEERRGIWVVGRDGKDRRKVLSLPKIFQSSACWSPDGKRIAVMDFEQPDKAEPPKGRLVILEVDGDGRTEFPLDDVKGHPDMPDWR
jgi:Tol biopolymer transport system component